MALRRLRVGVMLAFVSVFVGCKPRSDHSATLDVTSSRTLPRADVGPTIPRKGHAIFDLLLHRADNPAGKDQVPFPFTALRRYIDSVVGTDKRPNTEVSKSIGVLVPVGRSLQRFAADPDFFAFPRVLLMPAAWHQDVGGLPVSLENKLYIGYSEAGRQLEVISFNEELGRFEFQIVEDYADGLTPRVVHADRTLCVSCHQTQGPIFPNEPWDETNADVSVSALIEGAVGAQTYHSVKVRQVEGSSDSVISDSFLFNNRVDSSSSMIAVQNVWSLVLKGDSEGSVRKRGAYLKAMLAEGLFRERVPTEVRDALRRDIDTAYPRGMPVTDGVYRTRSVLGFLATPAERSWIEHLRRRDAAFVFDATSEGKAALETITAGVRRDLRDLPNVGIAIGAGRINDAGEFEPPYLFDADEFFSAARTIFSVAGLDSLRKALGGEDVASMTLELAKALARMESDAIRTQKGVLSGSDPLTLYKLVRDLRLARDLTAPDLGWLQATDLPPIKVAVAEGLTRSEIRDDDLRRAFVYCDACHRAERSEVPGFLVGTSEDAIKDRVRAMRTEILARVRATSDERMPPRGSFEDRQREAHAADFDSMVRWL